MEITYKHLSGNELYLTLSEYGVKKVKNTRGIYPIVYKGFEFFSPYDLKESSGVDSGYVYVLAMIKTKIVGVLKLRRYYDDFTYCPNYFSTFGSGYKVITYVNTHKDYTRLGILKGLYKYLNENLIVEGDYLLGTQPSLDGKKCDIRTIRKNIVTKANCLNSIDEYLEIKEIIRPEFSIMPCI